MKEHEKEHYEFFENEIQKRNIAPTKLLPLWDLLGVTLGFGTAMLGKKATMLCTASVEEVIGDHYKNQTDRLEEDEKKLKNNKPKSCKIVNFKIFGLSLATINLFISLILSIITFNNIFKNEKNK